ncbi:high-affinity branched-chain amino acid transporter ATP-binding protein [Bordetella pertussis]|nr:high-affinity branched-chain amino acid transporter ATP-binding protein [Bordetella pertussis]
MLTVQGLRSCYGRIEVLHGIDLQVDSGEIVTVVGRQWRGQDHLAALPVRRAARLGRRHYLPRRGPGRRARPSPPGARAGALAEGRQIFTNLSVEENLRLGAYLYADDRVERDMDDAFQMFPILREKRHLAAGGLSGGQQQMLAMARALMGRPSCLLLDEPSMGLAPIIVQQIFDVIRGLKALGVTVLLIEQNAYGALQIADRGYVMETGNITMQGAASALIADPRIRAAYLGI